MEISGHRLVLSACNGTVDPDTDTDTDIDTDTDTDIEEIDADEMVNEDEDCDDAMQIFSQVRTKHATV